MARRAGVLIPLFSFPSQESWGIGDIADVAPMARWLAAAGQEVLQLLPLNEMASGQQSPYSALTAMAIDPIYIRVQDVPEFAALGGDTSLGAADRARLEQVRRAPRVDYAQVRRLKLASLRAAFDVFHEREWTRATARARELDAFLTAQAWWLDEYLLYRAIHDREENRPWTDWPEPLRRRDPDALARERRDLSREMTFRAFLQWVADTQWRSARAAAAAHGVRLYGDLPFMVDGDSADVWARQEQFNLDRSVGVPPDAFSATGQDWGMPACRWDVMARDDFRWLRARARRSAHLFDGFRVDHLVGFYRTFSRTRDGDDGSFSPAIEAEQVALGETILGIFREPGADVIAEDLGTVPDFVRASLQRLEIPGFRVLRWEREWEVDGHPFREPSSYPAASVATSGTHDTEPMATWWESAPPDERGRMNELAAIQQVAGGTRIDETPYDPRVRDVLLEVLFASGSDLALTVMQDIFGWRDRINEPATVTDVNWTFRLPWPSDRLPDIAVARERQERLRAWAEQYGRRASAGQAVT